MNITAPGLKQWITVATCAWLLTWAHPSGAREPPAAGCIDLHDLAGGWRVGERELLIRSNRHDGLRLEVDPACPAFAEGVDLETLAPGGWACPGGRAFVRGGDTTCRVTRMRALSATELAGELRAWEAQMGPVVTLDPVEVRRPHWRDRTGTTDYCVDARFLRGWSYEREELVVDVAPHRHAGQRYYRVETAGTCSDLSSSLVTIRLESRNGGAAICGRPGDKVVLVIGDGAAGPLGPPLSAGARGRSCEITRVIPLPRE